MKVIYPLLNNQEGDECRAQRGVAPRPYRGDVQLVSFFSIQQGNGGEPLPFWYNSFEKGDTNVRKTKDERRAPDAEIGSCVRIGTCSDFDTHEDFEWGSNGVCPRLKKDTEHMRVFLATWLEEPLQGVALTICDKADRLLSFYHLKNKIGMFPEYVRTGTVKEKVYDS